MQKAIYSIRKSLNSVVGFKLPAIQKSRKAEAVKDLTRTLTELEDMSARVTVTADSIIEEVRKSENLTFGETMTLIMFAEQIKSDMHILGLQKHKRGDKKE